jgi:hypothetical protein
MIWGTQGVRRQGSVRMSEMCEDWSHYQNCTGADSPKSAPETEFLVPRAKHITPINVTPHQGRSTREPTGGQRVTSLLLLWKSTDRQEQSVSSSGTKTSLHGRQNLTIEEQYSCQNHKIYAHTSCEAKKKVPRCKEAITLPTSWFCRGVPSGSDILFIFAITVWKPVPKCIKRMCYELWNLLTQLSSTVRNGSSSRTQLLLTRTRQLRIGREGMFQHLSAPSFDPMGVQTSTNRTINCGLFWRTRIAKSITTTRKVQRGPSW